MLNLFKRTSARQLRVVADPTATRADLQIRNLLDDPDLRRLLGLDNVAAPLPPPLPPPRVLEEVAA